MEKNNGNGKKKRRPGPVGWWLYRAGTKLEIGENGMWLHPKGKYIDISFWRQYHGRRYVQLDPITGEVRVDGKLVNAR